MMQRQGGVAEAAIQVEGAVKQEGGISDLDKTLEAVTVASWAKIDRQKVDDVAGRCRTWSSLCARA